MFGICLGSSRELKQEGVFVLFHPNVNMYCLVREQLRRFVLPPQEQKKGIGELDSVHQKQRCLPEMLNVSKTSAVGRCK